MDLFLTVLLNFSFMREGTLLFKFLKPRKIPGINGVEIGLDKSPELEGSSESKVFSLGICAIDQVEESGGTRHSGMCRSSNYSRGRGRRIVCTLAFRPVWVT